MAGRPVFADVDLREGSLTLSDWSDTFLGLLNYLERASHTNLNRGSASTAMVPRQSLVDAPVIRSRVRCLVPCATAYDGTVRRLMATARPLLARHREGGARGIIPFQALDLR